MFKLIKNCESAKVAWDILELHCQGDTAVKDTRVRILITKFENLRMKSDELVGDDCNKILDIANECMDLGEHIPNKLLVSKVLHTLTPKFQQKVTAITTLKNVGGREFNAVMNDLKMFEMDLEESEGYMPKKNIALQASSSSSGYTPPRATPTEQMDDDLSFGDVEEPSMALLAHKVNALLKNFNKSVGRGRNLNNSDFNRSGSSSMVLNGTADYSRKRKGVSLPDSSDILSGKLNGKRVKSLAGADDVVEPPQNLNEPSDSDIDAAQQKTLAPFAFFTKRGR